MAAAQGGAVSSGPRKQYIEVPVVPPLRGPAKLLHLLIGAVLTPPVLVAAMARGLEGRRFRLRTVEWAARMLTGPGRFHPGLFYELAFRPMDSTRYFEFGVGAEWLQGLAPASYIDVSSPRLFALQCIEDLRPARALLLNPDAADLEKTRDLLGRLAPDRPVELRASDLRQAAAEGRPAQLVTCLSVLEHIPDPGAAHHLWSLVQPGGHLLVTLPVAARGWEQYISAYDYGVLRPGSDGYTFWQRFYDEGTLREELFRITGEPVCRAVYGERRAGTFFRDASLKRAMSRHPFWMEPWNMVTGYRRFGSIGDLPGEGVVALLFRKPGAGPSRDAGDGKPPRSS